VNPIYDPRVHALAARADAAPADSAEAEALYAQLDAALSCEDDDQRALLNAWIGVQP